MIRQYPSIVALRQEVIDRNAFSDNVRRAVGGYGNKRTHSFFGGETVAQTLQRMNTGDMSLVPEAEKFIAGISHEVPTARRAWQRSPAGAFPCVPEAIAGLPTSMRRQVYEPNDRAPITIFADGSISAALNSEYIQRRGAAILALVLALSRTRPVSLFLVSSGCGTDADHSTYLIARIETAPLDLATACYVLSSAGCIRRLYGLLTILNGFNGGFASMRGKTVIERLGYDPASTLWIEATDISDRNTLLSPVPWINQQIARFVGQQQEDYAA